MPRIRRTYGPFKGINTAVSKTDLPEGSLLDAQGVYHKELGRLHPCNERQLLDETKTLPTLPLNIVPPLVVWLPYGSTTLVLGLDSNVPSGYYPVDYPHSIILHTAHSALSRVFELPCKSIETTSTNYLGLVGSSMAFGFYSDGWGSNVINTVALGGWTIRNTLGGYKATVNIANNNVFLTPKSGENEAWMNVLMNALILLQLGYKVPAVITNTINGLPYRTKLKYIDREYLVMFDDDRDIPTLIGGNNSDVLVQIEGPSNCSHIMLGNDYVLAYADAIPARAYSLSVAPLEGVSAVANVNGRHIQGLLSAPRRGVYLLPRKVTVNMSSSNHTLTRASGTSYDSMLYNFYARGRDISSLIPYSVFADGQGSTAKTDLPIRKLSSVKVTSGRISEAIRIRSAEVHNKQLVAIEGAIYESVPHLPTEKVTTDGLGSVTGSGTAFLSTLQLGDWLVAAHGINSLTSANFGENHRAPVVLGQVSGIGSETQASLHPYNTTPFSYVNFEIIRPLSFRKRNRILFSGLPNDAAEGIPEDVTNWNEWVTPSIEIGDPQDGLAVKLLSVDDSRLLVFFEHAIWEITGTLPVGNVLPADFNINKIASVCGAISNDTVDIDRTSHTVYFYGKAGAFRMVGSAIEPIDMAISSHPEYKNTKRECTNVQFAGDRVYFLFREYGKEYPSGLNSPQSHVIWIYDTRNEEWTYTKRLIWAPSNGVVRALSYYSVGGISASRDQRNLYTFYRPGYMSKIYTNVLNPEDANTELSFNHVGRVRVPFTDLDAVGSKRIIQTKLFTGVPIPNAKTIEISIIGEGQNLVSRDISPDRIDNNAAVYISGGATGRGGSSVGIEIGDGLTPLPEIREIFADIQQLGNGGRA